MAILVKMSRPVFSANEILRSLGNIDDSDTKEQLGFKFFDYLCTAHKALIKSRKWSELGEDTQTRYIDTNAQLIEFLEQMKDFVEYHPDFNDLQKLPNHVS